MNPSQIKIIWIDSNRLRIFLSGRRLLLRENIGKLFYYRHQRLNKRVFFNNNNIWFIMNATWLVLGFCPLIWHIHWRIASIVIFKTKHKIDELQTTNNCRSEVKCAKLMPPENLRIKCWSYHVFIRTEIKFMFIHKLFVGFINTPYLPPCYMSANGILHGNDNAMSLIYSVHVLCDCLSLSFSFCHMNSVVRTPFKVFG